MDRSTNYNNVKRPRLTNLPYPPPRSTNWEPADQIPSPPPPPPRPPQPDTRSKDDIYNSFFEVMEPSVRSKVQVSDAKLNEMAVTALQVMGQYKDRITMFEFLNKLLKRQESLPVDEITKRVTVLRLFVRLTRGLKIGQQPYMEVKNMSNFFADLYNKTLEKVTICPFNVAVGHVEVLQSLKKECIRIGFESTQMVEIDNFLGTTKLSSQRDLVSASPSAPIMDVGAQRPVQVPALERRLVAATITTIDKVAGKKEKEAVQSGSRMLGGGAKFSTPSEYYTANDKLGLKKPKATARFLREADKKSKAKRKSRSKYCFFCNKVLSATLMTHWRYSHALNPSRYRCPTCFKSYPTKLKAKEHYKKVHQLDGKGVKFQEEKGEEDDIDDEED